MMRGMFNRKEVNMKETLLPRNSWKFVDKDGLPPENGKYLCSLQDWEGHKYTKYVLFSATTQRFFTIRGHEVYAWTELIQPA